MSFDTITDPTTHQQSYKHPALPEAGNINLFNRGRKNANKGYFQSNSV